MQQEIHTILNQAFERAVTVWGWLPLNPMKKIRRPSAPPPEPKPPTAPQAARIVMEAFRILRWGVLVWLAMTSGARRGELCALRRGDLSEDGTLKINKAVKQDGSEISEGPTKTHQHRRVVLDSETIGLLRALMAWADQEAAAVGLTLDDDCYLFSPTVDGRESLRPDTVTSHFSALAQRLGIACTFHKLRHYTATELILAGVDIRTVAGRLGHSGGGATTLRVYTAWVSEADQRAAVLTPAVTMTKTADLPNATLGTTVTYTVKITDTGQTSYPSLGFTDSLAGVLDDATYNNNAVASAGSVSYVDGTLGWTGSLVPGASVTVTYSVTIRKPATGDRSMANSVVSSAAGGNCAAGSTDNRCTAAVAVTNATSLTITKTADVAVTAAGKTVTYTVTITNSSILSILGAHLSDPLAGILDDADYNGNATANHGTVGYAGTTLSWTGTLDAGATATITYSVTVHAPATGDRVLTGTVSSTTLLTSNNCPANGTDPRCTSTVPVAALVIEQHYVGPYGTPGAQVHLSATFTNTGQYDYRGITISSPTDEVLDEAIPVEQSATSGTLVLSSSAVVWTGDIPIGATVTLSGTLRIKDPAEGDRALEGTISTTALGSNCPVDSTDERCTATLQVLLPGLTITKTANAPYMVPGGTVGYTITIRDSGQTPYTGATVTDSLAGLLDDADYNGDATVSTGVVRQVGQDLEWTGDLAVGQTATIGYTVTTHRPAAGDKVMINRVWSTEAGSSCLPASGDPHCDITVVVLTPALRITVSANQTTAVPGQAVTFTVTATNTGQTPYSTATVRVPLADVLDDAGYAGGATATSGSVTVTADALTWTGALGTATAVTVTYSVTVNRPAAGNHLLSQTAVSDSAGSTCPTGGSDTRCTSSVPIAELVITNAADVATAAPRTAVRHTVTMVNTGQVPYVGITVADSLAGALDDAEYNGNATATTGSLTIDTATETISWTGDIPVGGAVTVTVTVTVRYPTPGDKLITTAVSSAAPGNTCPAGGTDPGCGTSVRVLTPALTITKTADRTTATPGDTVGYTVVVTNTGETDYRSAVVTDPLAAALGDSTYLGDATATAGTVGYAAPTLTWTGDLAPSAQVVLSYHLRVNDPDPGPKQMINVVTSEEPGSPCPAAAPSASCRVVVTVLVPRLEATITADRDTTVPGATVGYTVTVANTGQTPYTAAGVRLQLGGVLDDAAYDGNATATGGTVATSPEGLLWTGDLAIGATATITYTVTVADPDTGDLRLVTRVVSNDPGSSCSAAGCVHTVTVLIPGLSVTTAVDRATATPGDRVVYTITVTNTGQTPQSDLTVTASLSDVLDDATFDGAVTATSGAASYTAPTVTWTGTLAVGTTATISYAVVVRAPDPGDQRLAVTAVAPAAGSSCPATNPAPSCTATTVVFVPRLSITKSAENPTTTPGSVVLYRIVVDNTGETAYDAATLRDPLEDVLFGADYNNDATVVGGGVLTYTGGTLTWRGALPVGASAEITYSVTVHDPATGDRTMVNTVSSTDPGSTCPADSPADECRATVLVLQPALTITKTADTTTTTAGGTVHYQVTVANTGQTPYLPATITDSLAGVLDDADYAGDASATTGAVGYDADMLTWTGGLDLGASAVITYSVVTRYPANGDHTVVNAVTSSSPGATCPTGTETGCYTSIRLLVPHLDFALSADRGTVVAGGPVRYTITATNTGQADYPAATIDDQLAGVLDDAQYAGGATASSGTVSYATGTLTWTGAVAKGATVTIGFSVTTDVNPAGDLVLTNTVSSSATGATCAANCTTSTQVIARFITLTDLTPSFALRGLPGATVELPGAVTMTVTTNSTTGYSVQVRAAGPTLTGPGGSFPVGLLQVRETGDGAYQPLSPDATVTVHSQPMPSSPGGDAVSNDYQVQVPDVPSGTYTTTLEYIAGTL
ncbi:DUF7507 domain-containing protein [Labedaea rhizosphaerae]|uniref:Putative repeat protein (TIGR01451 family) n=1 Tax=Labedaea rhizosphaerae TaxID=598644 RepID=A0A4R6SA85_LABRH|nr:tyrosine-type recombinase/integrase [Labedaea rhizosphaerae]TDP96424.1 putative repeat protein (TIGR01451 family) [Labedaea rhizosphaerae]